MKKTVLIALVFGAMNATGQSVGIGTNTPNSSAQLEIASTTKGLLVPRLTLTQRNTVAAPATGLLIYQTDNTPGFYYYTGSAWQAVNSGGSGFSLPYYSSFAGSLAGSRTGMQIDLVSTYGQYAFRSDVMNAGAVGFYAKAKAAGSTGALFTIDTTTTLTNRLALLTEDGNVILNSLTGNTGIGATPSDAYKLDVNGRMRLRHNGFSAGLWLNKSDNTESAFIGMINDSTAGFWGNSQLNNNWRVSVDVRNALVGIGTPLPTAPLSFASAIGNKIALWGNATSAHYGIGIQGSLLQLYTDGNSSDIAFGYGRSAFFNENFRIKGNGNVGIGTSTPDYKLTVATSNGIGISQQSTDASTKIGFYTSIGSAYLQTHTNHDLNFATNNGDAQMILKTSGNVGIGYLSPAFKLDVDGRMRIRHNSTFGTAGLWFNKSDNTQGSFIGQYDDNNFGIWGPSASGSWKFLVDGNDGTVRIGTTSRATGYLVNVGGKVIAEEVRVSLVGNWPDYVFGEKYNLQPIAALENYISANKHLPGIPAAAEIEKNGMELGKMQKKMMEKIEELTLYIIQLKKENDEMKTSIEQLQNKINH